MIMRQIVEKVRIYRDYKFEVDLKPTVREFKELWCKRNITSNNGTAETKNQGSLRTQTSLMKTGGPEEIRTPDPHNANAFLTVICTDFQPFLTLSSKKRIVL